MKPNGKIPYLNLGCGYTFHPDWTNLDFVSNSPHVIAHNLLSGIPFEDGAFEVVYHSHVLEHFPKDKAGLFLTECGRVLKPGGIIRIAVPDLERIAANYIKYLNETMHGDKNAAFKYDWSVLEMYDQVVRSKSGGDMSAMLRNLTQSQIDFLIERNGKEIANILEDLSKSSSSASTKQYAFVDRLKSLPVSIKHRVLRLLMGEDYNLYAIAKFRSQGEIHQWMYDRFSLGRLLENSGFHQVVVRSGLDSGISDWKEFGLDGVEGNIRKPDSLFMEGIKK